MLKIIKEIIERIKEHFLKEKAGDLLYVNGHENLPAPLTKEK